MRARWALAMLSAWICLLPVGVAAAGRQVPDGFQRHGQSTRLIVLLHAYTATGRAMESVRDTLWQAPGWGDADVFTPELPFEFFSIARPTDVVAQLLHDVDTLWAARAASGPPYERVLLVGHSIGSLYARKLYAAASGETSDAPFEPEIATRLRELGAPGLERPRPWAASVDRIVLLAGLNRGWSISHHMSLWRGVQMSAGVWLGRTLEATTGRQFLIMAAYRGAPFITQLRLQWLAMRSRAAAGGTSGHGAAKVVQLLGTTDDLVPPTDNVDPVTGVDFVYLEVPRSSHKNVVDMDDTPEGRERARTLAHAVTLQNFDDIALRPPAVEQSEARRPRPEVTDVVFVVHGIRDEGYWTEKIASRVLVRSRPLPGRRFAIETASYGYFPMLSFLRPGARQEKVEWMMDQYTSARAQYPKARVSFIGHSHGTYLLTKALTDYPAVRFANVVFAGSVVDQQFPWSDYLKSGRVGAVFNFVATRDWVVAFFPKALQQLRVQDLGSAGHDGFDQARRGLVQQLQQYAVGGHSAALDEAWWNSIADFAIHGTFAAPEQAPVAPAQSAWVRIPAHAAPLIWGLIAAILLLVLIWLLRRPMREWTRTLAVVAYAALVWLVLTRL